MNKEKKDKKFFKSKLFLFAILPLFVCFVIATGYVVSNLVLTVGVAEPFTVQYAVLGDGGDWNEVDTCANATTWFTDGDSLPYGNILIGEDRKFCVKITNMAEGTVPYSIIPSFETTECANAFGNPLSVTGLVPAKIHNGDAGVVIDGYVIRPEYSATPIENCLVTINVTRG